jgi:hypothetical protein
MIRADRYGFAMVYLISDYKTEPMLSRATSIAMIMLHNVALVNMDRHKLSSEHMLPLPTSGAIFALG